MNYKLLLIILLLIFMICKNYIGGGFKQEKLSREFLIYIRKIFDIRESVNELQKWNRRLTNEEFLTQLGRKYSTGQNNYDGGNKKKAQFVRREIPGQVRRILDIGTESLGFLDELELAFPGAEVRGINIEDFPHYKTFDTADKRFSIYDKTIPFENNDLVIINSVIHHVVDLPVFFDEVARVATGFIFIKDHDLVNDKIKYYYALQHDIYTKYFIDKEVDSYRRYDTNFAFIIRELGNRGFELVKKIELGNFSGSGYLIFKKN